MTTARTYADLVRDALGRVSERTCEEVASLFAQAASATPRLLDVREADELASGTLPGAVSLPRGLLEKHVGEHLPDRDAEIVVYCATGNRSALAADVMQRMGYRRVASLAGGIERWRHRGLPIAGGAQVCLLPGGKLGWEDVRREFAIVARRVPVLGSGERPLVYLDHAASTHAPASVLSAYVEFMEREYANIHRGTHLLSRKATERFDEAYYVVADYLGAELKDGAVCFTSNTTQAIDLASHVMASHPGKVITTELEHHSNELPHRRRGSVLRARVDDDGRLDVGHLEELLRANEIKLVAVSAGSNVTGVIPDVHQIARLAHAHGALILVDAAQALSRLELCVGAFDADDHLDFVAGAGHKAYAPFGSGFLYGPRALMSEAPPYLPGGGTASKVTATGVTYLPAPDRHHGGTPNIGGVVAMARSLLFLEAIGRAEIRRHELELTRAMMEGLRELGGVTLYGPPDPEERLGVVTFNVDGVSDLMTAAVLSEEGALAVRNGRFCAHLYVDKLLEAARLRSPTGEAHSGAVRASVGLYNDSSDVGRLLEYVRRVRDRKWVGRYRMRGDAMSAEFAGRCADHWMEATQEALAPGQALGASDEAGSLGYLFEALHPDAGCRSYLVADPRSGDAALVDPIRERVDGYLERLTQGKLRLKYVIETHTHADHLSGSVRLKELTGAAMLMHAASPAPCVDRGLRDGDVVEIGSVRMEVLATPGHSHDGVCLVLPGRVLTGDTLLIGGCGRTDLPTGDADALFESLQRLLALPDDTLVFPAHDYEGRRASTIGHERAHSEPLAIREVEAFRARMARVDDPPPARLREVLAANQKCV